jgi:hypothetical protein
MSDPRDPESEPNASPPSKGHAAFPALGVERTMEPNGRITETMVSPETPPGGEEAQSSVSKDEGAKVGSGQRRGSSGERGA